MMFLYRVFVAPSLILILPFVALFNAKVSEGLRLRRKRRTYPDFPQKPIWIHASSGEFEYAKSVIRELKKMDPSLPIVVTYFSPTYAKNVENFPGVDFALPLPLDLPGPVSFFLKRIQPRALLLSRTDFWPELLSQTRKRKIPIHVFSYTQKSPDRISWLAKSFTRWRLNMVDQIYCVSQEDKANIEAMNTTTPVEVLGDTRYDQVRFRLDHPKELPHSLKPSPDIPCLVAGSTWPEDETVLLAAVKPLVAGGRLQLILVPHETDEKHLAGIKNELAQHKMDFVLFSAKESWQPHQVLLVDQVGCLAELYSWGEMAFVGGSFKKTVHSVMEPLGAGLKTFVGPLHLNNREAIEFQSVRCAGHKAVTAVLDSDSWRTEIEKHTLPDLQVFKVELKAEFSSRLGAAKKLVESIRRTAIGL